MRWSREKVFASPSTTSFDPLDSRRLDYDGGMAGWVTARALVWTGALLSATSGQAADFELIGHIQPEQPLSVYLLGATTPFRATTDADLNGRFHFRKLLAGAYVLAVGGVQRTVEVGPSLADAKGRVNVTIDLRDAGRDPPSEQHLVSVRELSLPKEARREYDDALRALARPDVPAAVAHLRRAVEMAPQFSAAWNHLGTIAYQAGQFVEAEGDFRRGLEADPEAYAPLVNLGGVLINLAKWDEALTFNRRAVLKNPTDALANSQLGMAYFYTGQLDSAEKSLTEAKRIDPAHFSHPQLLLAEIHLRRNEPEAAAAELQDLLKQHPDLPNASRIKEQIAHLRAGN
jgi:tetratricopeptide (TPR) repeat protein